MNKFFSIKNIDNNNYWFILLASIIFNLGVVFTASAIDILSEVDDGIDLMEIPLTDVNGDEIRMSDYQAKFILLNFMFTSCHNVCPIQTASLAHLQSQLKSPLNSEIHIVSITLDPENDTAEKLLKHAEKFEVDRNTWSFLSGSKENIKYITSRFSAISKNDSKDMKEHRARIFLLDKDGNLLLSYVSDPLNVERVISDLEGFGS